MNENELQTAMDIARQAVVEVGVELKHYFGNVESKSKGQSSGVGDVFTVLDQKTERLLAEKLNKFSDKVGFRGEEYGVQSQADTMWLVDPIDGTANFIRGIPFCTTMAALIDRGTVVMSVIHDFVNDNTYWAIRGKGAFCNDKKISVSNRPLNQSFISFETRLENAEYYKKYLEVRSKAAIVDTMNSGFEFAMIASGKWDGKIGLQPYGMDWDFAPGSLLVTEAGGVASNIGKTTYTYTDHNFIIANPIIHQELTSGKDATFSVE